MQKHYYEANFVSRVFLTDDELDSINGFIRDLIDPEYDWETTDTNHIDSEGYDKDE